MEKLDNYELSQVEGGARFFWGLIGAAAAMVIGIISGFLNPNKCNNK